MKTLRSVLLTFILIFFGFVILAAPKPPQLIQIIWQDTNAVPGMTSYVYQTNSAYLIVGTTDLSVPLTNWPTVALVTNWSLGPALWMTSTVPVIPDKWFFAVITTNFWGTSDPSTVAQTGPGSTPPGKLTIR